MSKVLVAVASCALVLVTLSPVLRDPGDDGFPLSTYPMFATRRAVTHQMSYPLGVTRTGERRTLSPRLVGSGEILQAYRIVEQAATSRARSLELCRAIAARARGDAELVAIRIVTAQHDAIAVLRDDKLGFERELARCEVPR